MTLAAQGPGEYKYFCIWISVLSPLTGFLCSIGWRITGFLQILPAHQQYIPASMQNYYTKLLYFAVSGKHKAQSSIIMCWHTCSFGAHSCLALEHVNNGWDSQTGGHPFQKDPVYLSCSLRMVFYKPTTFLPHSIDPDPKYFKPSKCFK